MKLSMLLCCSMLLVSTVGIAGCDHNRSPVESAKDALDMRDHEKLKDAAEDARDAAKNASQGVRDETR